jgi:hypothetical protein
MNKNQGTQNGLVMDVINWFAHPFNTSGSAFNWILFVGLLVIAAWMWSRVLAGIMKIEEVA